MNDLEIQGRELELLIRGIMWEGLSISEAAKKFGMRKVDCEALLNQPHSLALIDQAAKQRSGLMFEAPIANAATRMKRLEEVYQYAEEPKDKLAALREAREEHKLATGIVDGAKSGPVINIIMGERAREQAIDVEFERGDREAGSDSTGDSWE